MEITIEIRDIDNGFLLDTSTDVDNGEHKEVYCLDRLALLATISEALTERMEETP